MSCVGGKCLIYFYFVVFLLNPTGEEKPTGFSYYYCIIYIQTNVFSLARGNGKAQLIPVREIQGSLIYYRLIN